MINHTRKLKIIVPIIVILVIIGAGYLSLRGYSGPVLSSNARVGYYGHKRLASFSAGKMSERKAAARIYLSRNKIDWQHPIKHHKVKYYFPKNMPKFTRQYVVRHD